MTINKKWCTKEIPKNILEELKIETQLPEMILEVLYKRGYDNFEKIDKFINPKLEELIDPFRLTDMEKAVWRIIKAIKEVEKIVIYGDYDVDGITSSALLYNYLESLGANVSVYIPNRLEEGYGLNKEALEKIIEDDTKLIITVDCATNAIEEIDFANERGCDVIVTDHHECASKLPDAFALINPMRESGNYPFKKLAGVGVAYKLVLAIEEKVSGKMQKTDYLDLVAIGTVADVVELSYENRILVYHGLKKIRNNPILGIEALLDVIGIDYGSIDSEKIGYVIGPRINAAGRMGSPRDALNLLLTDDYNEATKLSEILEAENKKRQDIQDGIFNQVKEIVETNKMYEDENLIVVNGDGWHLGIIGIVASSITGEYYKPTVICSKIGNTIKGSARSVQGFNIYKAIKYASEFLVNFGGHEQAAGLTIEVDKYKQFREKINHYAKEQGDEYLKPIIYADSIVDKNDVSLEAVEKLEMLAPFGEGNEKPVFIYNNLRIAGIYGCGKDNKHLKITFSDENFTIDAIGFNLGNLCDCFIYGDKVDVVGYLSLNEWRNKKTVQMQILDIKKGRYNA